MKNLLIPVSGLLLIVCSSALAQTGTGVVQGVVRDQTSAIIPGADVSLRHLETNTLRTGITSEAGIYYFGALSRGSYQIVVELPGFKGSSSRFTLEVGQTVQLDVVLEIRDISTAIDVEAPGIQLSELGFVIADVKDFRQMQTLPFDGRQITKRFELTPGVEGEPNSRVLGGKVGSFEITLDGVSWVDRYGGGMARVQPGLDSVQEFRIETVGSGARHSRPSTAIMVSRSGTNQFHGSVFGVHRNNGGGLRARSRSEVQGEEAKLIRNEFGVSVGGPLKLGRLYDGQDRTFWFFTYEGLRQNEEQLTNLTRVPTEAMWNGDLSNLIDYSGQLTTIYDPFTTDADGVRLPFPGNVVPPERIHPFARRLSTLTARPLDPSRNPVLENNFLKFYPQINNTDSFTIKGDQVISEKDNLSVRWTRSKLRFDQEGGFMGNPAEGSELGTRRQDVGIDNASINYVRTFSPSLLNEFLAGVHRSRNSGGTAADFTPWADELGLPNPFDETGWPQLYADGAYPWAYWDADNRRDEALTGLALENNVTWIRGAHVLQLGGKLRWDYDNVRQLELIQGSHSFSKDWTALYDPDGQQSVPDTGNGFAGVLLGLGNDYSARYNRGYFYFRQRETGLYFNDKWKVSPNLTVNLGLRWDNWTPYSEKYDRTLAIDDRSVFDEFQVVTPHSAQMESLPGVPSGALSSWAARGLTWTTADSIGYPENLFAADNNNLGPRLGISYMIGRRTVLRGSYGEYFWTMPLSQILWTSRKQPPLNLWFANELDFKDGTGLYTLRNAPVEDDFLNQIAIATGENMSIASSARGGVMWDGRNWKDAHARTWHISLEHEVVRNTALRFSYTGNQGRDLEQRYSVNSRESQFNYVARTGLRPPRGAARDREMRPNKDWNLKAINRSGFSNTHTGQIELERRFTEGIGFQIFYVYSRSLTTTDAGGFSTGDSGLNTKPGGRVPEWANLFQYPNELGRAYFPHEPSYGELLRMTYINSYNIPPHRIRYNGIADLPFGRGKRWGGDVSGALNQLIGGWQVAFLGDWRSGFWRGVSTSRFQFADPSLNPEQRIEMTIFGDRQVLWFRGDFDPSRATDINGGREALEALVPADRSERAVRPAGSGFNNRLSQTLADGSAYGTDITDIYNPDPRNFYLGPSAWNLDLSVVKHFYLSEELKLRLTADFFNFFNHPNDIDPNWTTGLVNLGISANVPRTIQLSVRFDW